MAAPSPLILHTTPPPPSYPLPSLSPPEIFLSCYLQLVLPRSQSYYLLSSPYPSPDSSPSGSLPFLQHGAKVVAGTDAVVKYLKQLDLKEVEKTDSPPVSPIDGAFAQEKIGNRNSNDDGRIVDLDDGLSKREKAEVVAWKALIDGELADLVNFTLYSLPENWKTIHMHLASQLPFPQSFYQPLRIRSLHQPRLTAVGLWNVGGLQGHEKDEEVVEGSVTKAKKVLSSREKLEKEAGKMGKKFYEDQIIARATPTLTSLSNLLSTSDFVFNSSTPTTLDIYIFSHLSLLLLPDHPCNLIADHIRQTYPTLVVHTMRILGMSFPPGSLASWPSRLIPEGNSGLLSLVETRPTLWNLGRTAVGVIPTLAGHWFGFESPPLSSTVSSSSRSPKDKKKAKPTKEELSLRRGRRWWFAGAALGMIAYLFASGIIEIEFEDGDEEYEEQYYEDEEVLQEELDGEIEDDDD